MRAGVLTAGLVVLAFLFAGAATASAPRQLGVDTFAVGPANSAEVVVTVRNLGSVPADEVSVELRQGRSLLGAEGGVGLAAGQATVFRIALGETVYTGLAGQGEQLYVLVKRRAGSTFEEMAVPVTALPAPTKKGISSDVVTALFSVGSLLAGILVTEFLTRRRERARSSMEARRIDVERDTPAFRAFVADWQGSIDPGHLESAFGQLIGAAGVPEPVRRVYRETLDRLDDPSATVDAKRAAAERLLQAVEELTRTPALD